MTQPQIQLVHAEVDQNGTETYLHTIATPAGAKAELWTPDTARAAAEVEQGDKWAESLRAQAARDRRRAATLRRRAETRPIGSNGRRKALAEAGAHEFRATELSAAAAGIVTARRGAIAKALLA